jgi:hypothetical protein
MLTISRRIAAVACFCLLGATAWAQVAASNEEGWIDLFNGKDLTGWKISAENPETFKVENGELVVKGERAHLFYDGDVNDHNFKNFSWRCEIMTKPNANSGMYFHTEYQAENWPNKGFEAQVNNTHGDPKKTGGLYDIQDVLNDSPAKDNEWFTQEVTVDGKHVVVKVHGEVTCDYTQPEGYEAPAERAGRILSSGTFALQGHDPGSEVHYRKVQVKVLPE